MAQPHHIPREETTVVPSRRERPWLFSYNRRLRHLTGITIRNLSLTERRPRTRSASIDDEALPNSLRSPGKLLTEREQQQQQQHHPLPLPHQLQNQRTGKLEHVHSAVDLLTIAELDAGHVSESAIETGSPKPAKRPVKRLRRRSTLEWANASPLARQRKLEDVAGSRMVDVFFSLHVSDDEDPIYISETIEKTMNPNFRFFDLGDRGPSVTRLDSLVIKLWVKTERWTDFQFLVQLDLNLRYLQFIGKSLESFHHPLPANCVLFHLTDGVYTILTEGMAREPSIFDHHRHSITQTKIQTTASYDTLMRLSTLDVCIQDALLTREKLEKQMDQILKENKKIISTVDEVAERCEAAESVERAVEVEKRRLDSARKRRDELRNRLARSQELMASSRQAQEKAQEEMNVAKEALEVSRQELLKMADGMHGQRRRICEDILRIYPIEPVPGKPLTFTICGLELPNSEFDDADDLVVAAALGSVGQVVHLLSVYLSVPLPYPIQPQGSTSSIQDPISTTTGSRTYPLFTKGTARFRFEYAVFLLNKNIEMLSNHIGLRVFDLRHTLPNLKYLTYIATAGIGELPARKVGVRAFMRGAGWLSPRHWSRRGSHDSTASSSLASSVDGRKPSGLAGWMADSAVGKLNGQTGIPHHGAPGGGGIGPKSPSFQSSKLRDVS